MAIGGVGCLSPEPPTPEPSAARSPEQGAPTADPTPEPPQKRCFNESDHESPQVETLGVGSTAFPVTASGLADDTHYVISRHMSFSPAVVAGYDQEEDAITYQEEVEVDGDASTGTWGATVSGDDIYIGMSFDDDARRSAIMKLDPDSGELTEVASTYPARLIWDMDTAPDGTIYAATSRQNGAGLWEYDPETEEAEHLQRLEEESRQDARSVAAAESTVYIGLGNAEADLIAYDRDSGAEESILPEELEDSDYVYALDATEEWVAVGTSSSAFLAVLDVEDPEDYSVVEVPSGTVQHIEIVEDTIYFTSGGRLWRVEPEDDEAEEISEVDPPGGQNRGLYHQAGVLHGTGSLGYVWTYDLESGDFSSHSLLEAELDAGGDDEDSQLSRAEPAQSLAVSNEEVFTGGHFTLGVRETDSPQLEQIPVPGEAKATAVVRDDLYMAMYSSGELVRYDTTTDETETVASAPEGHNRPRDLHFDSLSDRLFMTVQNDTRGGGALVIYDRESEETTSIEPFDTHAVSAVTSDGEIAYVAGSVGMQGNEGSAVVAAIDLETEETLWETTPVSSAESITDLVMSAGQPYGMTVTGDFFAINPETQEADVTESGMGPGGLVRHQGGVYGATADQVFALDLESLEPTTIADDLDADWFTWPDLASDGCSLYALEGSDVIQIISSRGPPDP